MKIGGRATLVRLPSGAVACFSPVALTDEVKSTVNEMGSMKYLVASDYEHHMSMTPWHKEYPAAKVIGVEGIDEKKKDEDIKFDVIFTKANKDTLKVDEEFDREFDYEYVPGHGNKELVFNFRRDKTLIEADMLFSLPAIEQYSKSKESPHSGFLTGLLNGGGNIAGPALWQRRMLWYGIAVDRQSFNQSVARIDKWDFDRIIPCHGDVIESGGKGAWRNVMKWHLDAWEAGQQRK
jgi:hypothetical protein